MTLTYMQWYPCIHVSNDDYDVIVKYFEVWSYKLTMSVVCMRACVRVHVVFWSGTNIEVNDTLCGDSIFLAGYAPTCITKLKEGRSASSEFRIRKVSHTA